MSWRQRFGMEQEPRGAAFNQPVFVTGCMRSGTSHVLDILTRHPQLIQVGTELNDVWTEIGGASCLGRCEHKTAKDFDISFAHNMTKYFSTYLCRSELLRRRLMRLKSPAGWGSSLSGCDWENLLPVNKSPHLINKIGFVHSLYPNSRWICIVRSIYGQSASAKVFFRQRKIDRKMGFYMTPDERECWYSTVDGMPGIPQESRDGLSDFSAIPEMWLRLNLMMLKDVAQLPHGQALIVSFEDLVRHQRSTVNAIFEFLDLDQTHSGVVDAIARARFPHINTSLRGDPVDQWKEILTPEEISLIDQVTLRCSGNYQFIEDRTVRRD